MAEMKNGWDAMAEACAIFKKYKPETRGSFHCEHDILTVCGIDPDSVSDEDKARLDECGFDVANEYGEPQFHSFRFGSC